MCMFMCVYPQRKWCKYLSCAHKSYKQVKEMCCCDDVASASCADPYIFFYFYSQTNFSFLYSLLGKIPNGKLFNFEKHICECME